MIEQLRTPPLFPQGTPKEQLTALQNYLYQTIQALNVVLLDIDKRIESLTDTTKTHNKSILEINKRLEDLKNTALTQNKAIRNINEALVDIKEQLDALEIEEGENNGMET